MTNYQQLIAWQKAMDLEEAIYQATGAFPVQEMYGLTSQVRRAAVSVPSNIAEGQGRRSGKEFAHHLSMAHGSLRELETQVLIAQRLAYLNEQETQHVMGLAGEVRRLITGLANSLSPK